MQTLQDVCSHIVDCKNRTAPIDLDGEYFVVGTPAMRGNVINFAEARRINKCTFDEWTQRLLPEVGDILFAREAPVGPVVAIPAGGNIAAGQRTMLFRTDPSKADSVYLRLYLSSPAVQARILSLAHGSTTPHLRVADVRSFPVDLPPLRYQRAIAEVLGALDEKIAANNKITATTAELATTYFSHTYEYTNQTFPLADLVSTQYGLTTSAHGEPGPKFLRVTDINKKPWIEWDSTPNCTVSGSELSKYRVDAGDILVARMADPGKAAFIDQGDPEAVFASYLVRLKPHDAGQALYLYYFLRSQHYLEYAQGAMSGSVQKNMNAKVIVATDIGLPDSGRILRFNESVLPLRRVIQSYLDENRKLAATRDALLPQLMSGRLRVKDAEALVAATV